jgi:hypothetical protein
VLGRGAQADARGAAQVLGLGAQAVARGATRCATQVLDLGAQAVARGNLADLQRSRVSIKGFICTVPR